MSKKVYLLSTCSTCTRIAKEVGVDETFDVVDIKTNPISETDIETFRSGTESYEALFSKRAMKFRAQGLHEKTLSESDYKELIKEEYTFLKRPVFVIDGNVFVGNSKKTVEAVKQALQ